MRQVVLFQALAALLMLSPLLVLDAVTFAGNSDAIFYTTILNSVANHLAAGDLHSLWLSEVNGGAGSPVMLLYCPLSYVITALLGLPLAHSDPLGWERLVLGIFVAQWLAGITAYLWLKRYVHPTAAMAASLLFTIFPYKLVYIFLHVNLSQLWAIVFLPLLMMAAEDLTQGKRKATVWYALWLALIALTHPRTLVAFAALPALYAFLFAKVSRFGVLFKLIIAHILGASLAAFYLLPAILNLNLVQAELANAGRMNYAINLSHFDIALNFHYAIIAGVALGMLYRLPSMRTSRAGYQMWFSILVIILTAVLCLNITKPLWDELAILQFLQFPAARLHVTALIAATLLVAFFFQYYQKIIDLTWLYTPSIILLAVGIMTMITFSYINDIYRKETGITVPYLKAMHDLAPILPPEYLTHWQPHAVNIINEAKFFSDMPMAKIDQDSATAEASFINPRQLHVIAHTLAPDAQLQLRQLYLPQWKAAGIPVGVDAHGLIQIPLQPGQHDFVLKLESFPGENEGWLVSLIAALVLFIGLILPKPQRKWPNYSRA